MWEMFMIRTISGSLGLRILLLEETNKENKFTDYAYCNTKINPQKTRKEMKKI
jgi:hypothetical protein